MSCGRPGGQPAPDPSAKPVVTQVLPLDRLYVLEMGGVPPEDTTVTFAKGSPRVVSVRHGAPDNTVFAELIFPTAAFSDSAVPDSIKVTLHPRPGIYGLDVAMSVRPGPGAQIRFKYPIHFAAPNEALIRYGGRATFEQALAIATRQDSLSYSLLASERPASDNLQAPFSGTGTYLVVAPRAP